MDEETALLYAKLKTYNSLLLRTREFVSYCTKQVKAPYLACSFGKDSAVMLDLVKQIDEHITVRFLRWEGETENLNNYDEVINKWAKRLPYFNLEQVVLNRDSLSDTRKGRYKVKGYDSYYIGLRAEESVPRRITLKKHGVFHEMKNGMFRICPLAWWKTADIHAYIVKNQLPMLKSYSVFGMESRTASRVPREDYGIRNQSLAELRKRDISAYNRLIGKFPEISLY